MASSSRMMCARRSSSSSEPDSTTSRRIACALVEPTRHGTHLPHDSLRKNRSTLVDAASRSVPSASTTIAPEPSIVPFSAAVPKSSGMSSLSGPMKFDDAPPGCTAPTSRPPLTPPASSISSRDGGAHRHAVDVGPLDVPGHGEELPAHRVADALVGPPLRAALHDHRHVGEGLHRVDQRRPAVQAVVAGERRLVARLAAVALHALQQRGLLAEDVAAGRDEHLDVQPPPAAAGVRPDHACRAQRVQLGAQHVLLGAVLVPDEHPALLGAHDGHAEQQPLQHQVRLGGQDLPVLERARLGLVGVADGVLDARRAAMPRTSSHFCPVGNPAPPIPRSPESFSVCTIVSGSSSPASSARRVAYRSATPDPAG